MSVINHTLSKTAAPVKKATYTKTVISSNDAVELAAEDARIRDLQKKIQDDNYLNNAIDRIAVVISRRLVENRSVTGNSADFLMQ
jgi:hypothetical protein